MEYRIRHTFTPWNRMRLIINFIKLTIAMERITDVQTSNMPSDKKKINDGQTIPKPMPVANYQRPNTKNSKTPKK